MTDEQFYCSTGHYCTKVVHNQTNLLCLIRMPLEWKCIFVTSFHRRIDVDVCAFGTVGIGLHRVNGSPTNALLSMTKKAIQLATQKFPTHVAFSRQIFGSDFGARKLHTIVQGIHLCSAQRVAYGLARDA